MPNLSDNQKSRRKPPLASPLARQRSIRMALLNRRRFSRRIPTRKLPPPLPVGYDPELVYVECGRCGSPVVWEHGKATTLLETAGIDPLELDSSCILLTDGCPACSSSQEYHVRIFRIGNDALLGLPHSPGHA